MYYLMNWYEHSLQDLQKAQFHFLENESLKTTPQDGDKNGFIF